MLKIFNAMGKRNFEEWIKSFKETIVGYSYYTNFEKVYFNVDKIKVELNILNSLINSRHIETDFEDIINKYPSTLKCIPILIAKRQRDIVAADDSGTLTFNFKKMNYPIAQYKVFMRKTGLFDLLENHLINNLVDYVTGVEVGMDTNGRKNRGGHLMEDLVESYIVQAGFIKGVTYFKEMKTRDMQHLWKIDLSTLTNNGKAQKKFDFVVKGEKNIYGIETNFYTDGGSKQNETARSYLAIAEESKGLKNFKFVWFTDGRGWVSAQNNLEQTFDILDNLYCIKDMEDGIIPKIMK